jgi:NADH-quinone oxidoreductase subunit L
MTRMVIMTFFGDARWKDGAHPHESPAVMTAPVAVLALLSLLGGAFLILGSRFVGWLTPVFGPTREVAHTIAPATLTAITLVVVAAGMVLAYWQYAAHPVAALAPARVNPLTVAARRDLYGDDFNEAVFMRPGQYLTRFLVFFDNRVVDGTVNGFAAMVGGISSRSRRLQTGFARSYALSMFAGAAVLVIAVVLVRI